MRIEHAKNEVQKNKRLKCLSRSWIVILSMIQVSWVPMIWAAGIIAGAATFGDKGYMAGLLGEAEKMVKENKAEAAVSLLEGFLNEYMGWRKTHSIEAQNTDLRLPSMYYGLATAKMSAGVSQEELIDAYRKVFTIPARYLDKDHIMALVWLNGKISEAEYKKIIFSLKANSAGQFDKHLSWIIKSMELDDTSKYLSSNLEAILNIGLVGTESPVSFIQNVDPILKTDAQLEKKLVEFCKKTPILVPYLFERDKRSAENLFREGNYRDGLVLYDSLLKRCSSDKDREEIQTKISSYLKPAADELYETNNFKLAGEYYRELANRSVGDENRSLNTFRVCQCFHEDGDYDTAILELDKFIQTIKGLKSPNVATLVSQGLVLKGRCYIQKRDMNKAYEAFCQVITEYPKSDQTPDAMFMVGYCQMFQGKEDEAKKQLTQMIKEFPDSRFVDKANLLLRRMEQGKKTAK